MLAAGCAGDIERSMFAAIVFLVICASILAVSALHTLMRHGHAARVTSLLYLTPIVAVFLEWAFFDLVPNAISIIGIAVTIAKPSRA